MKHVSDCLEFVPLDAGTALLRLNRPAKLNALTRDMVVALSALLDEAAQDRSLRVLIITGAGRAFCAGQDVGQANERNHGPREGASERLLWQESYAGIPRRIRAMPQIVIAAVHGACVGAGMGVALASDIRIAGHTARFMNAAVRLGLSAGECGMSYMLPRLIGLSRATEILLTGRPVDAEEANHIGLCAQLVDDEDLLAAAQAMAATVMANSPFGVQLSKRLLSRNIDAPSFDAALDLENCSQILASWTSDYGEATAAFSEKRAPKFSGR
jgi:enoyl-CoA hydratase